MFLGNNGVATFRSQRFRRISESCCSTIVMPPFEWDFPVYNTHKVRTLLVGTSFVVGIFFGETGVVIEKKERQERDRKRRENACCVVELLRCLSSIRIFWCNSVSLKACVRLQSMRQLMFHRFSLIVCFNLHLTAVSQGVGQPAPHRCSIFTAVQS